MSVMRVSMEKSEIMDKAKQQDDKLLENEIKALKIQVQGQKKINCISALSVILLAGTVIIQGFRIHDIFRILNKIISILEKIASLRGLNINQYL